MANFGFGFNLSYFCTLSYWFIKPTPLDSYINKFVIKLADIQKNGFFFNSKLYTVTVHSFNCDAPAKAYLKCIKSHGGYSCCDKCTLSGSYVQVRVGGRMRGRVVLKGTAPPRSDAQFRLQLDEEHHKGVSPLIKLSIELISCFPTDYMHTVCLGVMEKLLNSWILGPLQTRLPHRLSQKISDHLISLQPFVTRDFNTKPRSVPDVARWKATEYRLFVLYLEPLVLKNVLPTALYENFLLFYSAITILICKVNTSHMTCEVAHKLLCTFIDHCEEVYGTEYLIYNVHMLRHVSEDVKKYGPLDNYTSHSCPSIITHVVSSVSRKTVHSFTNRRTGEGGKI